MPTLSRPSGLGRAASTSNARLSGSAEGEIRVRRPSSAAPGSASASIGTCWPSLSRATTTSGTPKTTFTTRVFARLNAGAEGPASDPTSTERRRSTPSSGALSVASPREIAAWLRRAWLAV